jgi:hypothetical protein
LPADEGNQGVEIHGLYQVVVETRFDNALAIMSQVTQA